jgi:predicted transcriptional regulator of viral defense system
MVQNILALSTQETKFLSSISAKGLEIFTTADAQAYWASPAKAANVLSRLIRKGWIKRLSRGVYMVVPLAAGPDRTWTESAYVIAPHLIQPSAIGYWSALHYWNMTEQVPRTVFVQSTRQKPPMEILGMRFHFVTVKQSRFFGILQQSLEGKPFQVTDREKTLVDAAARPDLSGGVIQLSHALRTTYQEIKWPRLDDYLTMWDGGTVRKRLGYILETLALPVPDLNTRLEKWQDMLSEGISPLEPGAGKEGNIATRWRIRVNVNLHPGMVENDSGK